ncbi:hypothetical protein CsSME_00002382 [Camellia sinensis var. sinensis]
MLEICYKKLQESSEENMQPNYYSLKEVVQRMENTISKFETTANLNDIQREVNLLKPPALEHERRESPTASEMNFQI